MAGWRDRGYVQDSDEEEDSQISVGLRVSREAVKTDSKGAFESGEPHDVGAQYRYDEGGLSQAKSVRDDTLISKAGKGHSGMTTLSLQHEKENVLFAAAGHDEHDTEIFMGDDFEDVDELQQDHYRATTVAQNETNMLIGAHDSEARPLSSPCPPNQLLFSSSISSTPLSEVSSIDHRTPSVLGTQRSTCRGQNNDQESSTEGELEAVESNPQRNTTVVPEMPGVNQAKVSGRRARNLRRRNPIQLHPYAVESEQYRQTLKARGVKPLRIAQMEADAAKAREQDSQNLEYNGEEYQLLDSDAEQPGPCSSSPVHPQRSPSVRTQDKDNMFVFGDDGLPEMSTLLHRSRFRYVGNGHKRRMITNKTSTAFRMPQDLDKDKENSAPENQDNSAFPDDDVLFDVPPSPPHSGSQTPAETDLPPLPTFRMPRRPSPVPLPTPITSSEPRRRHPPRKLEDQPSRNGSHRARQTSGTDDSTDSGTSEEETSHRIQRVQREIRGVLPASWLKLDLKTQKKKSVDTEKILPTLSPQRDIAQRGIARILVAPGSRSPGTPKLRHDNGLLSGDEGSDMETDELSQQSQARQRRHHMLEDSSEEGFVVGRWGEAAEDDRIDAMLPPATRAFHSRTRSKRQTKIRDWHSRSQTAPLVMSKKAVSEGAHQLKIRGQPNHGHKGHSKFRTPKLGILDAPLMKGSSQNSMPQFLKVASRTARSRRDRGRHSPSQKYVRLATKDDDRDANETLQSWREGIFAPLANDQVSKAPRRRPLHPCSGNSCEPSNLSETERIRKESKLSASRMTSVRPHFHPKRSRKLQTSLDHLIERRHSDGRDSNHGEAPSWLQHATEKPKRQGQIVSSLQAMKDSRPATLESARGEIDQTHAQAMFHRELTRVNHFDNDSSLPNVLVRRFFNDDRMRPLQSTTMLADQMATCKDTEEATAIAKRAFPHKRRKRQPRRLSTPKRWSSEPSAPVILDNHPNESVKSREAQNRDSLVGLGPFGTRYSDTFDITPLPTGTCFGAKTLLDSGVFAKALKHAITANYERSRGYAHLKFKDRHFRWGPWNDTVSSELGEIFEAISQSVQSGLGQNLEASSVQTHEQVLHLQTSILEYFTNHLSFLDPIDRVAYVLRCKGLLFTLVVELINCHSVSKEDSFQAANNLSKDIRTSTLTLILANQLRQFSKHDLIPPGLQDEIVSLVQKIVHHTLDLSLPKGLEPFQTCLSKLRNQNADYRIQDHSIEAFVVAQHVLGLGPESKTSLCLALLKDVPARSSDGVFDITLAEQAWKQLFTLLPFFELDQYGIVETGCRFKVLFDNWTLIKRLISPVLEASLSNPHGQPPSFNSYCRAIFGRCLHLINAWGWRNCESIIGTLFDYFARNGLAYLTNEESKGSPLFLQHLGKNPTLNLEPEDRSFHILLKIIGSGLRHMRQIYTEKKIRDIIWRLMPNHGRSHPKEEAIRREHLDALRNHHDLLCTLYWASPHSCRPRLTVIRNLVNLETSHREACHINIRAWFNLVKFQLSANEPIISLEPFAEWHNHLLAQVLRQHSLARTEAEDQIRLAQSVGQLNVSKEILEITIVRNQRQVEAILGDALVCLKLAIDVAQDSKTASTLLSTTLAKVFDLFDANRTQAHISIIQALDVLIACASTSSGSCTQNDESQDYGDWSAFDEEADASSSAAMPAQENAASPLNTFQDPLRHLLWNCFGADMVPNDGLLLKVVDAWVIVAQALVQNGSKFWADYLGRFGNNSWSSLRDTEQTRKFFVYYLATLIDRDSKIYHDHKAVFIMSWFSSLVERESLLKFQHRLLNSLLDTDSENVLLQNLPFWKDAASERYQITASDFSDRRLSLISSVLSNVRVSSESAILNPSVTSNELRQELRDLLKNLMATMKRNYQEVGHGSNVKGAYVSFVHRVIELLQQHTSAICPIDRFFTDNNSFPLPATDPTYVVGQLKNYGLRLLDARTPKQLVVFLQSVSERAAIDGQQSYLVSQLHTAMSNAFEDGVSLTPTLRSFLVKNIIPAYVEIAFSTSCGWIPAMPYLQALQEVFKELLCDLDGVNQGSVAVVATTLAAFLDSVQHSLNKSIYCFNEPASKGAGILKVLSACYSAISALLPALDYIDRLPGPTLVASNTVDFFKSFATYFSAVLHGDSGADTSDIDHNEGTNTETSVSETRRFATQELRDTLTKSWICHEDRYYVVRGSTRREVVVDIGLYEEQKMQLLEVFQEFFKICRMMPALRDEDDDVLVRRKKGSSMGGDEMFF